MISDPFSVDTDDLTAITVTSDVFSANSALDSVSDLFSANSALDSVSDVFSANSALGSVVITDVFSANSALDSVSDVFSANSALGSAIITDVFSANSALDSAVTSDILTDTFTVDSVDFTINSDSLTMDPSGFEDMVVTSPGTGSDDLIDFADIPEMFSVDLLDLLDFSATSDEITNNMGGSTGVFSVDLLDLLEFSATSDEITGDMSGSTDVAGGYTDTFSGDLIDVVATSEAPFTADLIDFTTTGETAGTRGFEDFAVSGVFSVDLIDLRITTEKIVDMIDVTDLEAVGNAVGM
jgi:hypothetical protein